MKYRRLIILCNAMEDRTRIERGITTDSPAASRKIFMLCRILRNAGVQPLILSLGRGRQDGSGRYFKSALRRIHGTPILYLPFINRPILSQLLSLLAPILALLALRMRRHQDNFCILFYNRLPAYLPALFISPLLNFKRVLDLEDGETNGYNRYFLEKTFDHLCSGGVLLACTALRNMTCIEPTQCYYGVVETNDSSPNWQTERIHVLLGGTISPETGVTILIDALHRLSQEKPSWATSLHFLITGKGESTDLLSRFADAHSTPCVTVYGRMTDAEYRHIVGQSHVGLALKPKSGNLANTTFPSKVTELSGAGLLILTTDISDVRRVLEDGACYLDPETPDALLEHLRWIVDHRTEAAEIARIGKNNTLRYCNPKQAGHMLADFMCAA